MKKIVSLKPLLFGLCALAAVACSDDEKKRPAPPEAERITLNESALTLEFGQSFDLEASVEPAEAAESSELYWSSDNTAVATVDGSGRVTVTGAGKATISAAADYVTASCSVEVHPEIYVVLTENGNTSYLWKKTWKDEGTLTELPDGGISAVASDVYVSPAGDVYVVGWDTPDDTGITRAIVWKNGEAEYLSDGAKDVQAKSVTGQGEHVYIVGHQVGTSNELYLWRDGVRQVLPSTGDYAEASAATVNEAGELYIAGYDRGPALWRDGVKISDPLGDDATQLLGIATLGEDLFYCGYRNDGEMYRAEVWRNTQRTELTDGTADCMANAVWVSPDKDVYVAGTQSSSPRRALLWKNGALVELPSGNYKASDVAGFGKDLYVAGQVSTGSFPFGSQLAVVWINGEEHRLSQAKSEARALFVRTK